MPYDLIAQPVVELEPHTGAAEPAGGLQSSEAHTACAAGSLTAETLGVVAPSIAPSRRGSGPRTPATHTTDAAPTTSARRRVTGTRSTSASAGIAQVGYDAHSSGGDPTPSDRANVVAQSAYLLPGQDDGQSASRESQGSAAVVTPSEPAVSAVNPIEVARARGAARYRRDTLSTRGGSNPSDLALHVATPEACLPDHGGGQCSPAEGPTPAAASDLSAPAVQTANTEPDPLERGDGLSSHEVQSTPAVANLSEPADVPLTSLERAQDRGDGPCSTEAHIGSAVAKPSRRAKQAPEPVVAMPGEGDGQTSPEDQCISAVATIVDLWRQRCAIQRTAISVSLQAMAMCRSVLGDKDQARAEWKRIQSGKSEQTALAIVCEPYRQMVETAEGHASGLEKQLVKIVRKLPLWSWAKDVRGLGELSVAGLIGGAAGNPGDYKSVSALWKRFGLAVIEGQRQRRVSDPELALIHGYAPERRAFAYVVSANLMKCQRAGDTYRALYDRRKVYEMEERSDPVPKAHAHNRALRVMVKALLKEVWVMDRRLRGEADPA
jgi:hypothetical protein